MTAPDAMKKAAARRPAAQLTHWALPAAQQTPVGPEALRPRIAPSLPLSGAAPAAHKYVPMR